MNATSPKRQDRRRIKKLSEEMFLRCNNEEFETTPETADPSHSHQMILMRVRVLRWKITISALPLTA